MVLFAEPPPARGAGRYKRDTARDPAQRLKVGCAEGARAGMRPGQHRPVRWRRSASSRAGRGMQQNVAPLREPPQRARADR